MFELTSTPFDGTSLKQRTTHAAGGAVVVFEGRVRDHNRDQRVTRLEYEGAEAIARSEFAAIESEARQKFDVLEIQCVHRTGSLSVGDTAVWIGVTAPHRAAAFDACRYIIDELKARLPIWKKEYYEGGDSGWINTP